MLANLLDTLRSNVKLLVFVSVASGLVFLAVRLFAAFGSMSAGSLTTFGG